MQFKMEKQIKYLVIIIILLVKKSVAVRCVNNYYCECNEIENGVKCSNNNKETIDLILKHLINSEIKSLDLSFNELNNINIEIKSILKLNLSNNRLLILKER